MRAFMRALAAAVLVAGGFAYTGPAPAWAQADTGRIDGRIFDETKAAMPGVTVTARNAATGFSRTALSSDNGTYTITSLPAGAYDVTVELTGFATQVRKSANVLVGSATTVDFTMKVSAQAETITVTGEVPLVSTTTSDVGQVITQELVENIPLNGRKFQDLSLLVPGTRPSNYYDPTKTEVGGISYGGATGRNVIINVDGGDNNDGVVRGLLQQFSADAIQEYKVTTQRYTAEFGRSTGGVVNVITKSGTNEVKGSVFGFFRDDALSAKTHFEKEAGSDKAPFNQQQVGGTIGGPITKDKAHYFLSYEFNRRNEFATVFTNGILPQEEGNFEQPFRNHLITAKLDFQLGSNNHMVLRYAREDQKTEHDFIGGDVLQSSGALNTNVIDSAILKNTTVIGNNKLNEVLFLFQYFENNITAEDNSKPGVQTPDFYFGANLNTPQQTIQRRFQIKDDFSFRKTGWGGDHDFKVGAELIQSHYGGFFVPELYGYFNFSQPKSSLDAYLNGIADTFSGSGGDNEFDDNWTYVAGYVQDDWKPNNKLTLNLGLRYEIQTGPYTNDFDTISLRRLAAVGSNTQRSQDKNNLGPRVGFAYDVAGDAKTVVRGGYGRYFDEIFSNITLYEYWSQVSSPTFFVSFSPAPFTPNEYARNRDAVRQSFIDPSFSGQLLRLTAPDLEQPWADQFNLGFSRQVTSALAFDVDYVHVKGEKEVHRWRINTPQNVNTRISPAGVFAPGLGAILVEGNRGHSKFDAVYVTGKYRSDKVSVLATYTWSDAKNISEGFNTQPSDITNANWEQDWGPTPNDVRHRATGALGFELPAGFQLWNAIQWNTGKPFNASAGLGGLRNAVRATDPATGRMFPRNECVIGGEDKCRAGEFFAWDARLSRTFKMGDKRSVDVLVEVFNITDHVNYDRDSYTTRFTSTNFGKPSAILPNSQRQAQFGVRFRF